MRSNAVPSPSASGPNLPVKAGAAGTIWQYGRGRRYGQPHRGVGRRDWAINPNMFSALIQLWGERVWPNPNPDMVEWA